MTVLMVVPLVIWVGLFLYILRVDIQLHHLEQQDKEHDDL